VDQPNAFADPGSNIGRFGDSTAGNVVGPGTRSVSLSLLKRIKFTESSRMEIEHRFLTSPTIRTTTSWQPACGSSGFGAVTSMQSAEGAGPAQCSWSPASLSNLFALGADRDTLAGLY